MFYSNLHCPAFQLSVSNNYTMSFYYFNTVSLHHCSTQHTLCRVAYSSLFIMYFYLYVKLDKKICLSIEVNFIVYGLLKHHNIYYDKKCAPF